MAFSTDKARAALVASLNILNRDSASLIDSHTLHDPATHAPLLDTLDDDVVNDVREYNHVIAAIEEALEVPASERVGASVASHLHDPRAYGVTVTVDVMADSFGDATEAFIAELGIQNPEGLVFHVEHLNTGQTREL